MLSTWISEVCWSLMSLEASLAACSFWICCRALCSSPCSLELELLASCSASCSQPTKSLAAGLHPSCLPSKPGTSAQGPNMHPWHKLAWHIP